MSKRVEEPEKEQFLRTPYCKGPVYLKHYQIVRCDCGNYYWALQPTRSADYILMEWPGDCRTGPRGTAGQVARQNGPVARSTQKI